MNLKNNYSILCCGKAILLIIAVLFPQFACAEEISPDVSTPSSNTPVAVEAPVTLSPSTEIISTIEVPITEVPTATDSTPVTTGEPAATDSTPVTTEEPTTASTVPETNTTTEVPAIPEATLTNQSNIPIETTAQSTAEEKSVPTSTPILATPAAVDTVHVTIRTDAQIVFSEEVPVGVGTSTIFDAKNNAYTIADNTVLGMISHADAVSDAFTISDLAYFPSFDSFLINCISTNSAPYCYNWQYTVNDVYPYTGIDKYILNPHDDVYFYFGNQTRFFLSTTTISEGEPLTVTTEKYDYRNNGWVPRPHVTIGATTPDPQNPWAPIVVTSTQADATGHGNLLFSTTGTYAIGIGDDYYYPTENVVVTHTPTQVTTTTGIIQEPATPQATTGDSPKPQKTSFDVGRAISFLGSHQSANGAIGPAPLYSDWAAIAIGSYPNGSSLQNGLAGYLRTDPYSGSAPTDYERRAMALMALGISPYTGTKTNYIEKIISNYQNNQFGDSSLVNDDIFAIIPLLKAGYSVDDLEIKNAVAFIIAHQNAQGGWDSPDMTAAAIQALSPTTALPGVNEALAKAKNYLLQSKKSDGRIGDNNFSTSWGMQAFASIGENQDMSYIASQQQEDGGMELQTSDSATRVWSTSYAIPAAQNKTWNDILQNFSKSTAQQFEIRNLTEATSSIAITTSTITISTSTISFSTSTTEVDTTKPPIEKTPIINTVTTESVDTKNIVTPNDTTFVPKIAAQQIKQVSIKTKASTQTENNPETLQQKNPTIHRPMATQKRVAGGAGAAAGSAALYLAWRFVQGIESVV